MKHASHKAAKVSRQRSGSFKDLFAASRGAHSKNAVVAVAVAATPKTRREIRLAAKAQQRRNNVMGSAAIAALLATAATAMAVAQPTETSFASSSTVQVSTTATPTTVSRDDARTTLSSSEKWNLSSSDSNLNVDLMSRSTAKNKVVAALMDKDYESIPDGFNPNHATGDDSGNAYPWGQCTWYAYNRRAELGLPVASHFGNGGQWGAAAKALGYWVDNTPRHQGDIISFAPGQANADGYYGHVAIVEKVNSDGSIEISEANVKGVGVISKRTFTAKEAAQFTYIHY